MRLLLQKNRLKDLLGQRNLLVSVTAFSFLLNFLLSLILLFKQEKVIIMPPELSQSFWIEKGRASVSYLEEMSLFFMNLILDVTPSSAGYQREVLLRYALPKAYSPLKQQLLEEEERLKKENLSTSFRPSHVNVSRSNSFVEVKGDYLGFLGNKKVFEVRQTYHLKVKFQKGRLFLESFELKGGEQHG